MEKELKAIIQAEGREAIFQPDALMGKLSQMGCSDAEVMALGLLLKGCPPVAAALRGDSITEAESNVLISAAVSQTGLGVPVVRRMLDMLARCAGVKTVWTPKLLMWENKPQNQSMIPDEGPTLAQLEKALQEPEVSSETIHDLDVMSREGSIRASYLLGEYFHKLDGKDGITGQQYFQRAARQGYGPAYGALADYMLKSKRRNMAKAAALFEHPNAITGHHGRPWAELNSHLLQYREENSGRINSVLGLQVLALAATLLLLVLGFVNFGVLSFLGALVQVLSLGYLAYARIFGPYFSCKVPCYAMLIGWLLLALAML